MGLRFFPVCQTEAGGRSPNKGRVRAREGTQLRDDGLAAEDSAETALRRSHSSSRQSDSVCLGVTSGCWLFVTSRASSDDVIRRQMHNVLATCTHAHTHTRTQKHRGVLIISKQFTK